MTREDTRVALRSMTGFGSSTFEAGGLRYACTARSVNRRYFEVTIRLPPELASVEPALRALAQDVLGRGEVVVSLDRVKGAGAVRVEVDEAAARAAWDALNRVAAIVGAPAGPTLADLLVVPDLLRVVREEAGACEDRCEAVVAGVRVALDDLVAMRDREGEALLRDIGARLESLESLVGRVREALPGANRTLMERAVEKARQVAALAGVDAAPGTIERAIAGLAEKTDISEEMTRLAAHLQRFREAFEAEPPHGRRFDFLCQELTREAGTLSAKCQCACINHLVVEAKAEIERIREQAANVL